MAVFAELLALVVDDHFADAHFGGDFAIGRTIPYVLKHAPCAVWVVREPMPEELQ